MFDILLTETEIKHMVLKQKEKELGLLLYHDVDKFLRTNVYAQHLLNVDVEHVALEMRFAFAFV